MAIQAGRRVLYKSIQVYLQINILPSSSISSNLNAAQEWKHLMEQVIPRTRDIPAD